MIGYSPDLVTGIWTGYDDNRSMEIVKETTYAKNIWASFMEIAHQELPVNEFKAPDGVINVPIDPETGLVSTPYCPKSSQMYFIKGTEPKTHCTEHFPHNKFHEHEDNGPEKGIFQRIFELFM